MAARNVALATLLAALAAFYAATAYVALHPQVSQHYRDYYIDHSTRDWRPAHDATDLAEGMTFDRPAYPADVDYVSGLAAVEPEGRWWDARLAPAVTIQLARPVTGRHCLEARLRPGALLVGQAVAIRIGESAATLTPSDEAPRDYRVELDPGRPADAIVIEPARVAGDGGDWQRRSFQVDRLRLRPGACPG